MNLKWYDKKGAFGDIAVSTRIRFARNLSDLPFPENMSPEKERVLLKRVSDILIEGENPNGFTFIDLTKSEATQAYSLVERHLISNELAGGKKNRGLVLSEDESQSVMINEEDHIRIQVLGSGLCLKECLDTAFELDDFLDSALPYAFDEDLGYLTRCPTNVGTGMRASVMLHLPALTETGAIQTVISAAAKLGFAVRGLYGEGSASSGALYQISNQLTLGLSESEIVSRLIDTVSGIIEKEKSLRNQFYHINPQFVEDRVWRAAGILATARIISTSEAMSLLSDLRIGLSLKILNNIDFARLNKLIGEIQPNTLSMKNSDGGEPKARDVVRAGLIRDTIAPVFEESKKEV